MSNYKISELQRLTSADAEQTDLFLILDSDSDGTGEPRSKAMEFGQMTDFFNSSSIINDYITSQSFNDHIDDYTAVSSSYVFTSASLNANLKTKLNNSETGSYVSYGIPVLNDLGKVYNDFLPTSSVSGVLSIFGRTGNVVASPTDYTASSISISSIPGMSGNNVQSALSELNDNKLNLNGGDITGNLSVDGLLSINELLINNNCVSTGIVQFNIITGTIITGSNLLVTETGSFNRLVSATNLFGSGEFTQALSASNQVYTPKIRFSDDTEQTTAFIPSVGGGGGGSGSNGIKSFIEYQSGRGSRDLYDGIAFIDPSDTIRVIGNNVTNRFGLDTVYSPGISLYLPDDEEAGKLFAYHNNLFCISKTGLGYCIGKNTVGQCGISGSITTQTKMSLMLTSSNTPLSNLVEIQGSGDGGDANTFYALTSAGDVYSFGENSTYGALGIGTLIDSGTRGPNITIGPNNSYGNPTVIITKIVVVGSYNGSSTPISCAALGQDGRVYTCGYGDLGQIGNNLSSTANSRWVTVSASLGVALDNIESIQGSGRDAYTTFYALDSGGTLYGWGYNGYGQLGVGDLLERSMATQISTNVTDFWASGYGSLFVKKSDTYLYSCGRNVDGCLGLGDLTTRNTLINIDTGSLLNSEYEVDEIYTGIHYDNQSVFALVHGRVDPTQKALLACGFNDHKQLGLGDVTTRKTFEKIRFRYPNLIDDVFTIYSTGLGGSTWIKLTDNRIFFAGISRYSWGTINITSDDVSFFSPIYHY